MKEAEAEGFTFYIHESNRYFIGEELELRDFKIQFTSSSNNVELGKALDPTFKGVMLSSYAEVLNYNQIHRNQGNLKIMKQNSFAHPNVFYFRKNFFLIEAIDRKLEAFRTAGLIEYWTYNQLWIIQSTLTWCLELPNRWTEKA